ncbi:MAG: VOC family protein [Gammaproteobacteria bacterium]|nr:VOC family protein [Gammaproteobacteria bacterium]
MQLDHMNISASLELLETVKDFYCDALGFRVGPRPEIPIPGYWLYPGGGDRAIIHLIESNQHSPPNWSHLDHVAFQVADLEPTRAALESRGIPFEYISLPDYGLEQIQFTDPAGIKIEINATMETDSSG